MTTRYVGIKTVNSPAYAEAVFEAYQSGRIVVPVMGAHVALPDQILLEETLDPDPKGGWFSPILPDKRSDEIAQISFSSGTEGPPKGIALSHNALLDVVERINAAMGVDDTIREYIGIPVFYSFGLGRCRAVARARGRAYVPEAGFNLTEFLTMLSGGDVNALSAVPTLLRLVIKHRDKFSEAGQNLKWLEIGSQYISRDEKEAIKEIFPNAAILLNYGLTEASRSTLQIVSEAQGDELESVGRAEGAVEMKLNSEGRICLRGPNLATYLLVEGERRSLVDDDGWFVTGDVGEIKDGHLYFNGRADDLINCAGIKVSAEVLEQELLAELPAGMPVAVTGVPDLLRGERIFVAVEPGSAMSVAEVQGRAEIAFANRDAALAAAVSSGTVDHIPRTHTNKVRRAALRDTVIAMGLTQNGKAEGSGADTLFAAFQRQFPSETITKEISLDTLGGTSLDFIELELEVERILGGAPADWHKMPLSELSGWVASSGSASAPLAQIDQLSARALCCVLVVLAHVVGDSPAYGLGLSSDHWLRYFNELGGYFKMPLFAFVSGWTFSLMGSAALAPGRYFSTLGKTVVLPTVATILVFALLSGEFSDGGGLNFASFGEVLFQSYAHFWFIQSLIGLLIVTYLVMRFTRPLLPYFLGAMLVLPMIAPGIWASPVLGIDGMAVLGPFFALGLTVPLSVGPARRIWSFTERLITPAAAFAFGVALWFAGQGTIYYLPGLIGFALGLPMMLFVLRAAGQIPGLKALAPYTFYIFLWHVFFTSATRRLLDKLGVEALSLHIAAGLVLGVFGPLALGFGLRKLGLFRFVEGRW